MRGSGRDGKARRYLHIASKLLPQDIGRSFLHRRHCRIIPHMGKHVIHDARQALVKHIPIALNLHLHFVDLGELDTQRTDLRPEHVQVADLERERPETHDELDVQDLCEAEAVLGKCHDKRPVVRVPNVGHVRVEAEEETHVEVSAALDLDNVVLVEGRYYEAEEVLAGEKAWEYVLAELGGVDGFIEAEGEIEDALLELWRQARPHLVVGSQLVRSLGFATDAENHC
ncbi:hypothetical protein K458DRAFT_434607 [Lentithecium fluviatile CBS 122367]|uniref:Uncharacterized protein n=1 Tax=Lentithecium fluviatile CBS 122367 TaxID=1168545 RepID=A0A6G1IPR6_9PLEO|nr:hypothetical protein K458DRAFT_434607 [Lentithecium fluviatile CBS 122367]